MLLCRTDQCLQEALPSVTAAKEYTRNWKQRYTSFCNAQICNTGSFFSINKWQRKYFSLTYLIRFSLSSFRTYMKICWCFGSYLCRNIENSKWFTNFQAALYIYIYIYTHTHTYTSESEWALLPGMFTHTRNLFSWQKLRSATEWQWQDKNTDNKKKHMYIYVVISCMTNILYFWF